jgi:GNAT superfamily N-acetyltransferase
MIEYRDDRPEQGPEMGRVADFHLDCVEGPSEDAVLELRRRLQEYNRPFLEIDREGSFLITTRDPVGLLLGGIACTTVGQWLEIDYLWVAEGQRGRGLGALLVEEAERKARLLGCTRASLNTFSFQARPFYEKRGYRTVHVQAEYPRTNARYFMEKRLGQDPMPGAGEEGCPDPALSRPGRP